MVPPYCSCAAECTCGWKTEGSGGNVTADVLHPERGVVDSDEVAYVILEPIQGKGYRIPNTEFLEAINARDEYGIRVIVDEIQSGVGRTGEMWAVDRTPLDPDIITSGKALRVGATISRSDVFPEERGRLSSTWGPGVLSSLMAVRTLEAIDEYDLLDNASRRGRQMRELLTDEMPDCVVDIREKGLMWGVEFDSKRQRDAVVDAAFKRGLLTWGVATKLSASYPLDVTKRETELGVSLLATAIRDVAR